MFEEIDKEKEPLRQKERKVFEIENISNKEIGIKIKNFAKFLFIFQEWIIAIAAIIFFIAMVGSIEEFGGEIVIEILFITVVIFILLILAYCLFLIISGFGALIEDVNQIKENTMKVKTKPKTTKNASETE